MQNPFNQNNNEDPENQGPGGIPLPPNYATVVRPDTGEIRIQKVGFSFTAFLFSIWPAIFRSDWYNLLCMLAVNTALAMLVLMSPVGDLATTTSILQLLLNFLWGAIYNMMYFRHLTKIGYVPADDHSKDLLGKAHYLTKQS